MFVLTLKREIDIPMSICHCNAEFVVFEHVCLLNMDEVKMSTQTKSSGNTKAKKDEKDKVKKPDDDKYSSEFLRQKVREHFHHSDFKSSLQKDAIKEIMRGKM